MAVQVEIHPTLAEAQRALGPDGTYLGGGTLVMRDVNAGAIQGRIIRTGDPALRQVRASLDSVEIGAGVTMAMILAERDLPHLHPVARAVGGPQVRVMATMGGNLFAAHPYGDMATALLALGARVVMAGGAQRPLEEFLRDRSGAGLVAALQVPRPRDPRAFGFVKVSRVKPKGVSVMSIAAHLPRDGGRLRNVRIAFGAMGPTPLRAMAAERSLEGAAFDAGAIARAAAAATEGLDPPTDALASAWYRREVAGVHLRRLLERML
jgi:CO/xanthine dehydrogenase FAD-binding subunit